MAKRKTTKKATKPRKRMSSAQHDAISSERPPLSVGLIGHVDHGKTTLVQALSGKWTDTHSEELKRGITIRLGYADVRIYKCPSCKNSYVSQETCPQCAKKGTFVQLLSLVDAPGHESLMATMLSGASIFDGAVLLVAANEKCPQPQTLEHLMALEIMNVKQLIVVQNKVDLVSVDQAKKNEEQIRTFLADTPFKDAPIIPISARHNINVDILLETITSSFTSSHGAKKEDDPQMFVVRSFDVNKPGTPIKNLQGGVLGGVLRTGRIQVGDTVEILPGYDVEEKNQRVWKPLSTQVEGLIIGGKPQKSVTPGGTFALLTTLDPAIVKSDKLSGSLVGHPSHMPPVWHTVTLETHILDRLVEGQDKLIQDPIKKGEWLMLNVNAAATVGRVKELSKNKAQLELKRPIAAAPNARMTISRRMGTRWRLVGYGLILEQ